MTLTAVTQRLIPGYGRNTGPRGARIGVVAVPTLLRRFERPGAGGLQPRWRRR